MKNSKRIQVGRLRFSLLKDETALDCCYRANAELMGRGASMYRRFNSPYLVKDILAGI